MLDPSSPLKRYVDFPVLLVYNYTCKLHLSARTPTSPTQYDKWNVMTCGSWTWWYDAPNACGVTCELGNHSFTYGIADRIKSASFLFPTPNKQNADLLKWIGSNHGDRVDKLQVLPELILGPFASHAFWPYWCFTPIDVHCVKSYFKLLSMKFMYSGNGYPFGRFADEDHKFYKLTLEELDG